MIKLSYGAGKVTWVEVSDRSTRLSRVRMGGVGDCGVTDISMARLSYRVRNLRGKLSKVEVIDCGVQLSTVPMGWLTFPTCVKVGARSVLFKDEFPGKGTGIFTENLRRLFWAREKLEIAHPTVNHQFAADHECRLVGGQKHDRRGNLSRGSESSRWNLTLDGCRHGFSIGFRQAKRHG